MDLLRGVFLPLRYYSYQACLLHARDHSRWLKVKHTQSVAMNKSRIRVSSSRYVLASVSVEEGSNISLFSLLGSPFASPSTRIEKGLHLSAVWDNSIFYVDTIYIKTQVFRLLRYYSPAPRNIARSDWATQNITHNMTSSIKQPYGVYSH